MASIIKVDQLSEKTQGSGITLSHSLKNSSGSEIISPSGTVSNLSKLSLTPSSAPSLPTQGDMYLDSSDNKFKIYTGSDWKDIIDTTPGFLIDFLLVAGGGSGGGEIGGGGGAGGVLYQEQIALSKNVNYVITVGAGGAATTTNYAIGFDGNDSVLGEFIAYKGGGGSRYDSDALSNTPYGSGGGSGRASGNVGKGTYGQGHNGGVGAFIGGGGESGGGGGAGAAAQDVINANPTAGGIGVTNKLLNAITHGQLYNGQYYVGGGGGGGAYLSGSTGLGGIGGGGNSVNGANLTSPNATQYLGGGSGGGGASTGGRSGAGGSGVIIFKVPDNITVTFSAGVTSTITELYNFKIYKITQTSTTSETVTFS